MVAVSFEGVCLALADLLQAHTPTQEWWISVINSGGFPVIVRNTTNARLESDLPRVYNVTIAYEGPDKHQYRDNCVIDLNLISGMNPSPPDLSDLVKELEKLNSEVHKWTDGISGLAVNVSDRDLSNKRSIRKYHHAWAKAQATREGWRGYPRHFLDHILRSYGWKR